MIRKLKVRHQTLLLRNVKQLEVESLFLSAKVGN